MPQKSNIKHTDKEAAPLIRQGPATIYDQDSDTEFAQRQEKRHHDGKAKKASGMDRLYTIAMVVFALIFLASATFLVKRYLDDRRTENEFADLQSLIGTSATEGADQPAPEDAAPVDNAAKFAALLQRNPDFIGWLSIDGTNLDYPIMHKPDSVNYYLKHDFNGNYSDYGVPYLDEKCTVLDAPQSNNFIIYGHNMKTGTIFGCLTNYKQADYYAEHPNIEFDTLAGDGTYKVFAAFAIDVVEDQSFLYNEFTDMDEETFNSFVAQVKERSNVKTEDTPIYGDQLLTLSTCEYSTSNGRFVVCAYRTQG